MIFFASFLYKRYFRKLINHFNKNILDLQELESIDINNNFGNNVFKQLIFFINLKMISIDIIFIIHLMY